MFRGGAVRSACRSLPQTKPSILRQIPHKAFAPQCSSTRFYALKHGRPLSLAPYKPASVALARFATTRAEPPYDNINFQHEKDLAERKLQPHPERVSSTSGMPMMPEHEPEDPWGGGIKSELKVVQETFSLSGVPRDALYFGLAGVLPYLATSLSTVYLAWDLNHAAVHGFGVFLDADTARFGLQIMEHLQIGYGAVIISFLGAVHLGFQWAGFKGSWVWDRYKIGVLAPAVAWPTLLLPVEHALITQFLAFNYLYFVDATATNKGIAPEWYGIYRFVLTFIVGASIVLSLVGRGQVAEYISHPERPTDLVAQYADRRAELMEREEREKAERRAREAEEGDEEEEEDAEEEGDEE